MVAMVAALVMDDKVKEMKTKDRSSVGNGRGSQSGRLSSTRPCMGVT